MQQLLNQVSASLRSVFAGNRIGFQHVVMLFWLATSASIVLAQSEEFPSFDDSGSLSFPDTDLNYVDKTPFINTDKVDRAVGIDGRIGFIGLPAFGRDDSIVPVELFPYLQKENSILFGDIRGFLTTRGKVGTNAGVGFRFIEPSDVFLFGVNGFYDADASTGRSFQQMSVGWEARTEMFGLFGNVYMPVGTTEKTIKQAIVDPRFDGNNVLFDVRSRIGKAMTGLDVNFSAYLPGDFLREHQVQATAGWYHFEGDAAADDINGFKLQLQGYIVPSIGSLVAVTRDDTFGTNVNLGIFWRFGTRTLPTTTLQGQLRNFVDRNYNVIVTKKTELQRDIVAHNADGSVMIVQHIGNNTGTGDGTYTNPFTNVTDAQGAALNPDVIFVHQGSTIAGDIVLADGQSLLGEGGNYQFRDDRYGNFTLPGSTSTGATPIIDGSVGNAVTLGDYSQIGGFTIRNSGGHGIVANGKENIKITNVRVEDAAGDGVHIDDVTNGTISNVTVSGAGGNGVSILNIDDVLSLNNIYVEETAGYGVHIDGGLGAISFEEDLIIQKTALAALRIENMEKLTEVDDKGTTSTLDDETTITPSMITIGKLVVRNAGGGYGEGISTQDNEGLIGIGAVDIETEDAAGVLLRNDNAFLIANGVVNSKDAAAIDVEDSSINLSLTSVFADGGTYGMRFKDSTGMVAVYGNGTTSGSGGMIQNTDVGVYMENFGTVGLQTVDFKDNGKMAEVDGGYTLAITGSKVTGTTDMFIDARNLTVLQMYQSTFTDNTISSNVGIRYEVDQVGSFSAAISDNLVADMPGTFVSVKTLAGGETASLTYAFQNNSVELISAAGVASNVDWTGPLLGYVTSNTIVGTGVGQTALRFHSGDETGLGQINASNNLIQLSGVNSTGIEFNMSTPVNVIADRNQIDLGGANSTGIRASLGKTSAIALADNVITDFAGGATGILFSSLEHQTQVALDNNTIDLSRFGTFVDRGIVLSNITGNSLTSTTVTPLVTFISSASNTITGATTPYVVPTTGLMGRLIINDTAVYFP